MEESCQVVAIDTDFLLHLTEMKDCDQVELSCRFFDALNFSPVISEFLHANELEPLSKIVELFLKSKVLQVHYFVSGLNPGEKIYYENLVKDFYFRLNGVEYPFSTVFSEWRRGCNFGEVHSVAMCMLLQISVFLSDDSDSKKIGIIVEDCAGENHRIKVLTRADAVAILTKDGRINRADRQKLTHRPKPERGSQYD